MFDTVQNTPGEIVPETYFFCHYYVVIFHFVAFHYIMLRRILKIIYF